MVVFVLDNHSNVFGFSLCNRITTNVLHAIECDCVYTCTYIASVPGLPRSVHVLIMCIGGKHSKNVHGTVKAWNRGYYVYVRLTVITNVHYLLQTSQLIKVPCECITGILVHYVHYGYIHVVLQKVQPSAVFF